MKFLLKEKIFWYYEFQTTIPPPLSFDKFQTVVLMMLESTTNFHDNKNKTITKAKIKQKQ